MGSRSVVLALVVAVTASLPVQAADVLVNPDWLKRPQPEDLLAVWPMEAFRRGQGGRAVIQCKLSTAGALFDCKVVSETPPGAGFGAAAIALTPQLLMKPATRNGVAYVFEGIRIPINFEQPGAPTGSYIKGPGVSGGLVHRMVSNVAWRDAPTYARVLAAYPEKARAAALGGRATLNCTIKADGHLTGCATITESPKGYGFSGAARGLMGDFVAPATTPNGDSLKGVGIQVPVTFEPRMLEASHPVIGQPQWIALPEITDVTDGYPKAATAAGVLKARVVVSCEVAVGGAMRDCKAESENPPGLGLGAAALALSTKFRLSVWTAEGLPTIGGRVSIPIRYDMTEKGAPPAKP